MFNLKTIFIGYLLFGTILSIRFQSKIFNGETSAAGQFPYFVFIKVQSSTNQLHCAGTLISDKWILTAAHCVAVCSMVKVYLGFHQTNNFGRSQCYDVYANNIHIFPEFNLNNVNHDIALICLPQKIQFNPFIQSIQLSKRRFTPNLNIIVIGNGAPKSNVKLLSMNIQFAVLTTVPNHICNSVYPFLNNGSNVFCAFNASYSSPCIGDGGGPVILENDHKL